MLKVQHLVFWPWPIQPYHLLANLIWWDGPFKKQGIHLIFDINFHPNMLKGTIPKWYLCQTRMAGVVDVVYVNIVTWSVGCERAGELAKGGAVIGRLGTRVDGYLSPRAKKQVLQINKLGTTGSKGLGWMRHYMMCKCWNIGSINDEISVFRLKITHAWDARATCV